MAKKIEEYYVPWVKGIPMYISEHIEKAWTGRPPKKGRRLPKLAELIEDKKLSWTKLSTPYWYGDERCILEIVTGTAVWYHSGLPPAPIRWVLVRDPTGVRDTQAFLCTNPMRRLWKSLDGS